VRRLSIALSAALVVLLATTAVSCGDDADEVSLGEVVRADVAEVVVAPATVVARAAATLTAASDGTLAQLLVQPGDEVSAGDVLAVVDSPAAQRRLEQAAEALAAADQAVAASDVSTGDDLLATQAATDEAAMAAFEQARVAAQNISDPELQHALLAQVTAAEHRYLESAAAARQAARAVQEGVLSLSTAMAAMSTAQHVQAQQAYDLAQAGVDALTLRAPFDGVVQLGGTAQPPAGGGLDELLGGFTGGLPGGRSGGGSGGNGFGVDQVLAVGAQVRAGTPVVTIVDLAEPAVVAEVDETDVLLVEPGQPAEVELDAAPGVRYEATVGAIDLLPTPSPRGGVAYRVRLDLGDGTWPDGRSAPTPRPGMSAVVHLRVREAIGTLAVPAAAVLRVDGADVVWVARDGRAERAEVRVGVQGQELVQILTGLGVNDRIVVRGADRVAEGQRLP
jgi:HlyD family secretion protein